MFETGIVDTLRTKADDVMCLIHTPPLRHGGIEITNHCNLHCKNCPTPTSKYPKGYCTVETFRKALQIGRSRQPFSFHRQGEPLLHPNIAQFVFESAVWGYKPVISTNGTLLTTSKLEELCLNGLWWLEISLHTPDSVAALKRAIWLKENMHSNLNVVGNWLSHNKQVPAWIDDQEFSFSDRQYVRVIPTHTWCGNVPGTQKDFGEQHGIKAAKSCWYIRHNQVSIRWDGNVTACCYDSEGDTILGHIDQWETLTHKGVYRLCQFCGPRF